MTPSDDRFAAFQAELEGRDAADRRRRIESYVPEPGSPYVVHEGRRLLSFCSNDYLGLATDPEVVAAAARAAESHGAGSGASRLVVGGFDVHRDLEAELADFTGREAALLFASGFQANSAVIPAVTGRRGLVVCDRGAHASILQGCRLSRADFQRFRHNDVGHLDELLGGYGGAAPALVVTESLFSMDGDRAPLEEICGVVDAHGALLMVDDAHAFGVWGERGEGLTACHSRVDLMLGTFGKALGSAGAFVATSELMRSYLVNFCGGVIYSTAPPPPSVAAARASLEAIRSGRVDPRCLRALVATARERLRAAGFDTSPSESQIVPILRERGILAVAIRPPTVPEGTARLRISLGRLHTEAHLDALVAALVEYRDEVAT
jgi:8-amino-7-oxononanoate synthase